MNGWKFGRGFYPNAELPTERAVREAEEARWRNGMALRPIGNDRFKVVPLAKADDDCVIIDTTDNA